MPTKKEVYDLEQSNDGKVIHLYPEGMFFRAYEQSAFLLCEYVHQFKVSCHYVKKVNDCLSTVGFPQTSLAKWAAGFSVTDMSGRKDVLLPERKSLDSFGKWKSSLPREQTVSVQAVFSSLKVYGDAYLLTLDICRLCSTLHKSYKYSLGEELRMACMQMLLEIQAVTKIDSVPHIKTARCRLRELQLCLRILSDLNEIGSNWFLQILESTTDISKQLESWERSECSKQRVGVPVQ